MEALERAKSLLEQMSSQTYTYQPYAGAGYLEEAIGYEAGKKCALLGFKTFWEDGGTIDKLLSLLYSHNIQLRIFLNYFHSISNNNAEKI